MRISWLVIVLGCGHGRGDRPSADAVIDRIVALTPTCTAPVAVQPQEPIKIGRAEIPTADPAIVQAIECHGPTAHAALGLDADRGLRSLELTVDASPGARGQIRTALSPLLTAPVVEHIDKGLDNFLIDIWPFGSVSAGSMYAPATGEPRTFTVSVTWR